MTDSRRRGQMSKGIYLIAILVIASLSVSVYSQQEEHLVGRYSFDDEYGDEVIDSSGNGNNGEFIGGVKRVDGYFERGLEFNGIDAFVEIPDSESLALTDGLTIAMWIYLRSYSTAGGTGVTKENCYKMGTSVTRKEELRLAIAGGKWVSDRVLGDTDVPLKEWHHIAGTYDAASGDAIVYLDGEEDGRAEYSGEIVPNTEVVWIGRGWDPYFDGLYDEVAIWNVPLFEDEIRQVMTASHAVDAVGKLAATWGRIRR